MNSGYSPVINDTREAPHTAWLQYALSNCRPLAAKASGGWAVATRVANAARRQHVERGRLDVPVAIGWEMVCAGRIQRHEDQIRPPLVIRSADPDGDDRARFMGEVCLGGSGGA